MGLEAYFDESARPSGVFGVAGYVFDSTRVAAFDAEWRGLLGTRLPFHMVDLVGRRERFNGITSTERDALLKGAVAIINRHAIVGMAVACNERDFAEMVQRSWAAELAHPYSVCAHFCLALVGRWLHDNSDDRQVAYMLEAGHQHMREADRLFQSATRFERFRTLYRYERHAFVTKEVGTPIQAADLFAWEWAKYYDETRTTNVRKMRASLVALMRGTPGKALMVDKTQIERFYDGWMERARLIAAEEASRELGRPNEPDEG